MMKLNLQTFALKRPTPPTGGAALAAPQNEAPTTPPPAAAQEPQTPPPAPPAQAAARPTPPAPAPSQAPAVQSSGGAKPAMMQHHDDVQLDGFDEWNSGNFISIDGSEFYCKREEKRMRELMIIVSSAKQYYQWVEEIPGQPKVYHDSPTKIDDRYKVKGEIHFYDYPEGEDEPREYIFSLPTTSVIAFREYLGSLRDQGVKLGSIWTKITIERLSKVINGETVRYGRAKFENAGVVQYDN